MEPTRKSKEVRELQSDIMGVPDITENIRKDICASCKQPALQFKDAISEREFAISGFCQKCQDSIFTYMDDTEDQDL